MKRIDIIPTGGLCNRMRAMASGIFLAQKFHLPATIYWNNSSGLKADFQDLFQPISLPNINIVENKKWIYKVLNTKGYLLRLPFLHFKKQVLFNFSSYNKGDIMPHINLQNKRDLLLVTCFTMCEHYPLRELFVPQPEIRQRIEEITGKFAENTVGVHIRRTDNYESIRRSPLNLFFEHLEAEIRNDENVMFYVATDSEEVKNDLKQRFPGHILTCDDKADRESLEGMKFAVVDFFCLSKTRKIIGSDYSSYSQIAAELGGIPLEYASSNKS